jgi:hypothetical protein
MGVSVRPMAPNRKQTATSRLAIWALLQADHCPPCRRRSFGRLNDGQQFITLLWHLRILIVLLGFAVGIFIAFAWQYL